MAKLLNMDRCVNPRPVTFIAPEGGIQRGDIVEIIGMATNSVWLDTDDDFEAYEVRKSAVDSSVAHLLINTTVPKQYDERLDEKDFVCPSGHICRGHYLTVGDEYTLPVVTGVAVGDKLALGANGLLVEAAGGEATEVVVAEVVRLYDFNGQASMMIRIIVGQ